MKWQVYWRSSALRKWRLCGGFETFSRANEQVDYLMQHLPAGSKVKFRISNTLKSYTVKELMKAA